MGSKSKLSIQVTIKWPNSKKFTRPVEVYKRTNGDYIIISGDKNTTDVTDGKQYSSNMSKEMYNKFLEFGIDKVKQKIM